ncbi:hypothetical protein WMY93_031506 [Mugilogobius chulae]|uniref:Uncharacterized protein n=1 Tax=Mugilogobius chulae TaxID=88201 RepID=A0AAW0MIB0_9GOBI
MDKKPGRPPGHPPGHPPGNPKGESGAKHGTGQAENPGGPAGRGHGGTRPRAPPNRAKSSQRKMDSNQRMVLGKGLEEGMVGGAMEEEEGLLVLRGTKIQDEEIEAEVGEGEEGTGVKV